MRVATKIKIIEQLIANARRRSKKIALVPTMGYLHEGHLSLIRLARKHADYVVVSIFVNPIQFGPKEDFKSYPRNRKRDLSLLKKEHVDLVFCPGTKEIFPSGHLTFIKVEGLSKILCGVSRPTHFQGVTTIVLKLFNIIKPDLAVFGQKDYQQLLIIKKMVRDLNLKVRIIAGKTIRESDGLAMSSRNVYLTDTQRRHATTIYKSLRWIKKNYRKFKTSEQALARIRAMIKKAGGKIDYVEALNRENLLPVRFLGRGTCLLVAVFFGKTRLIDNIII